MMRRILVIGSTGNIGQHLARASLTAGHPTAILVRPATVASDSGRVKLLNSLKASGASIVYGDMNDHGSLVAAMKEHGEVVISAVGHSRPKELDGQLNIVEAIKEAGCVKRFLPSEFGVDVELAAESLEPATTLINSKLLVRRAMRAAGIPHTIVCSNWAMGLQLCGLVNSTENGHLSTLLNSGDHKTRVTYVDEKDMSMLAIRTVDDPRALDKIMYVRPPSNIRSFDQLVHLLEKKTGRTHQRRYVSEQELAKKIQEAPYPLNFQMAMLHASMVNTGAYKTVDESVRVQATQLYPDVKFVTVEEYLDGLLL